MYLILFLKIGNNLNHNIHTLKSNNDKKHFSESDIADDSNTCFDDRCSSIDDLGVSTYEDDSIKYTTTKNSFSHHVCTIIYIIYIFLFIFNIFIVEL